MNRSRLFLQLATVFIAASTMIGCRHQTQTIVVDEEMGDAIPIATKGDTLEWRLTGDYAAGKFYIHFSGDGPCGGSNPTLEGNGGFASCKVDKDLSDVRSFPYTINRSKENVKNAPTPCTSCIVLIGPRSCPNCATLSPQALGDAKVDGRATIFTQSTDPNSSEHFLQVKGGTNPGPLIEWGTNNVDKWTITFQPAHKFPCTQETEPIGNKCHLPQPRLEDYTYTVSAPGYDSKDFTIPMSK